MTPGARRVALNGAALSALEADDNPNAALAIVAYLEARCRHGKTVARVDDRTPDRDAAAERLPPRARLDGYRKSLEPAIRL